MMRFGSLVAGLLMIGLLTGCPAETPKDEPVAKGDGAPKKPKDKKVVAYVEEPTDAVVKVKIAFDGAPPKGDVIKAMLEHNDKDVCKKGEEFEHRDQTWIVSDKGDVSNVVVSFEPPEGKKFKEKKSEGEVVLDQPHCVFVPHIIAVRPGQTFVVKNASDVTHNSKIAGSENDFNLTINAGKSEKVNLKAERQPLTVSCQIHGWMQAKVYAPPHPYIGVTNEKGEVTIPDAPSGVELTLVIQHEGLKEPIRKKITLKKGDNDISEKIK